MIDHAQPIREGDAALLADLFDHAADLEPAAREAFIRERCVDDPTLEAQLRGLLAHDSKRGGFDALSAIIGRHRGHGPHLLVGLDSGTVINDRYRIVEILGEGGMGAVYLAQQQQPRRMVAIKIIRPAFAGRNLLRRFEFEAAVLARLNHPYIAQIYEAGFYDAGGGGLPYFVMEHVEGPTLAAYAANRTLPLDETLELFIRICEGVHHAHQKGVVHRDLKPANILVTHTTSAGDAADVPKILDFGVARSLDSDLTLASAETSTGQLVGTLTYMSPEQVNGRIDDVDTRSDIYALGVILFELLSGRRPHELHDVTIAHAARIIAEEEPPSLGSLRPELRGDLSTIVAKTLEKDPARRYASAADLAEDLRRYQRDEPVHARPATTLYQMRKFARRNKALVGGIAATFIVLLAGIAGTTTGMFSARSEADRARAITAFMNDILMKPAPERGGNEVRLIDVLTDASQEIEARFADHPDDQIDVYRMIGGAMKNLALHRESLHPFRRAYEIAAANYEPTNRRVAVAQSNYAEALYFAGRYDEAEATAQALVATLSPRERETTDSGLNARRIVGIVKAFRGEFDDSAATLADVAVDARAAFGELHVLSIASDMSLGVVHFRRALNNVSVDRRADFERAAEMLHSVVERETRVGKANSVNYLSIFVDLASIYSHLERYDEALAALDRFDAVADDLLHPGHELLSRALQRRGEVLACLGKWQPAADLLIQSIEMTRRSYGDLSPEALSVMSDGLIVLERSGAFARGEEYAAILGRVMKGHGAPVERYHIYHARFVSAQGRMDEADDRFDSLASNPALEEDPSLGRLFAAFLAEHRHAQGNADEARRLLERAAALQHPDPDGFRAIEAARIHDAITRLHNAESDGF